MTTIQGAGAATSGQGPAPSVPNIQPFAIDPIILSKLNQANIRPSVAGVITILLAVVLSSWTALMSSLFYRTDHSRTWWNDIWSFALRNPMATGSKSVPYLNDYPVIVLTLTIPTSVFLVYSLFCFAEKLHREMERSACIRISPAGVAALANSVDAMNQRFVRRGKYAPAVLGLAFVFAMVVNLRLRGRLFTFSSKSSLYNNWWASLRPFHPGSLVWIFFGGIGIYMVYVEANLGLTYLNFLRKCKGDYQFKANMLNPDGFFGWSPVRSIVSNLEAGVLCTFLSSWAMWFYLQPALGSVVAVSIIVVFSGVVLYVFVGVTYNFRRQVKADKYTQRVDIGNEIVNQSNKTDTEGLLGLLVAYKRLELTANIPSVPIRPAWLLAGAISIVGSVSALAVQLLKYFTGGH